jgi:hypothetical protein
MAGVAVALTPVPGLVDRVVNPGDIQFGDGQSIPYSINRGGGIRERNVVIRTITYNIKGLEASEVTSLTAAAERRNELAGSDPVYYTITISGRTYEQCYLVNVTPSGGIQVDEFGTVDQTTLVFETKDYQLI